MISYNDTLYESENEGTIPEEEKTVRDTDNTVPEGNETVLESGTTMYDATFYDAAIQGPIDSVVENISIQKGTTLLDTYTVESDSINGGMGSVWRVHHKYWNMDLAMKRPQPQYFSTEESKNVFVKECETWINLGLHPNIVSCYYVREISGVPSIFAEWMDGGSLEDQIRSGKLYEGTEAEIQGRILDIAIQVARGLNYAHEKGSIGIIHRDVKPSNILLNQKGEVKVSDFGISKTGGYSLKYCSREQLEGAYPSIKNDIYSWAVSVMEMYVGDCPWINGEIAGLQCRKYFEDNKRTGVTMPEDLKRLLEEWLCEKRWEQWYSFRSLERELEAIYSLCTGNAYPHSDSKVIIENAEILNNRAISYLDLGKIEEAKQMLLKSSYYTWEGPNLALYNYWLLNNDSRSNIWEDHDYYPDDNDVLYCLCNCSCWNKRCNEIMKKWNGSYPEVIAPFIPEIEDKVINAPKEKIKYFKSAKVGWIDPSGEKILLVDENIGKLKMINPETEDVYVEFDDPGDERIKMPLFVCGSSDGQFVYVIEGYYDYKKQREYERTKEINEVYSEEIFNHFLLYIWNGNGRYLKTLTGPESWSFLEFELAFYQKGRYLICSGASNWFWDLQTEKCYKYSFWGQNNCGERVVAFKDIESEKKYLSSVDHVYNDKEYISDSFEAIQKGYNVLEEVPDICGERMCYDSDRMDGMEKLRNIKKAESKEEKWSETIYKTKIPDTNLWMRIEKFKWSVSCSIKCTITEPDGFEIWDRDGQGISFDDAKRKILISRRKYGECLTLYSFESMPKRFRRPYLVSKVRSVKNYNEDDYDFQLLEEEMEERIRNLDGGGAIEVLKHARKYQFRGYLFRVAKLSSCIGTVGIPKRVSRKLGLTKNEAYATLVENVQNDNYIGEYCFKCSETEGKIGSVLDYPYIDQKKGMFVDGADVYSKEFTNIEIYPIKNRSKKASHKISGIIKWLFTLKDNKTLIIVTDDPVYLPIKPIYRRVKSCVSCYYYVSDKTREKKEEKYYFKHYICDMKWVLTRYKLYKIDLEDNTCKMIGKGLGRNIIKSSKDNLTLNNTCFKGSISFMHCMELTINDQKKDALGNEIILKNSRTGEVLDKFWASDICISDDGMYLIKCPYLSYDNRKPELYLLDWDWGVESGTRRIDMIPAELHYDIEANKKIMKKNQNVSFIKWNPPATL